MLVSRCGRSRWWITKLRLHVRHTTALLHALLALTNIEVAR
ncbi:hypothetical protein ACFTXM_16245 [Streptomyces sp. NPDC056930]